MKSGEPQEAFTHEPAHQHESPLVVERSRQVCRAERPRALASGHNGVPRLRWEPDLLALEEQQRAAVIRLLEVEYHRRAALEQVIHRQTLESPKLAELVVQDRPAV